MPGLADVSIDAIDVSAVLSDGDALQRDFDLWLAVIVRARRVFGRPPAGFDNTRFSVGRVVGRNRHVN